MLKKSVVVICILIGVMGFSQESKKAHAPLILKKLFYQNSAAVGNYTLKFSELISDSRCPIGVTCVWAGEVVFKLQVFKGSELMTAKTFNIPPTNYTTEERKPLVIDDKLKLYVYNVMPAPKAEKKMDKTDYYVQFMVAN